MKNNFTKLCPKCGGEQHYSCKSSFINAVRKNKVCNSCRVYKSLKYPKKNVYSKTCPDCGVTQTYSCRKSYTNSLIGKSKCKKCRVNTFGFRNINKSVFKTDEYRKKQSEMMKKKRQTESFGDSFKEKCRINKLKKIQEQGVSKTYNENACKFIDQMNEKFGYKLQHALNGGEITVSGFSLDGYDKEKNIVFEYDEPKHNKKCQIEKDKIRQQIIIDKLNPIKFLRFNEEYNKLIDILSGREILI